MNACGERRDRAVPGDRDAADPFLTARKESPRRPRWTAATIDALVAATALTMLDDQGVGAAVVLLTSDPDDLTALLSGVAGVQVIRV